jgi:undecaprenyl-diphosphatase
MRPAEPALALRHAVVLGLVQGPAELLPISSSAHTALIPWLAGWPYAQLDAELRKSFEVALHAGAGSALAVLTRRSLARQLASLDGRGTAVLALSLLPAALAGSTLRRPIERRLGGPRVSAAGLLAGSVAMTLADRTGAEAGRRCADARPADGLALGLAQALALIPGISRSGATLAAARARGFARPAAHTLSWSVALPVILGAGALEGLRAARGGATRGLRTTIAAGGAAAFLSTLASALLLRGVVCGRRTLLACSLYRCLLAALVLRRLRRAQ